MRCNVNIDEQLVKEIDEKAKSLHLSRSAYISMACSVYNRTIDRYDKLTAEIDGDLKRGNINSNIKNLYEKLKNE